MAFETRNVKKTQEEKEKRLKRKQQWESFFSGLKKIGIALWAWILRHSKLAIGIVSTFILFIAFASYFSSNTSEVMKRTLSITTSLVGENLKQNEEGFTNILLIGSGGEDHEGGFLTDSIIVLSLNNTTQKISMLSIPRDLYLSFYVNSELRKGKINEIFRDGMIVYKKQAPELLNRFPLAAEDLQIKISEIIGAPLHYTVYIDFQGFVKVVDALGGVTVDVEKDIYDPMYPGPNYTYQTFSLKAGVQNISGKTALKYVRSRHGNAGGDFGRSTRQKQVLFALKEKALSAGVLTSPSKIQDILKIIQENFWTDMSWQEMLTLIDIAGGVQKDAVATYNITNTERVGSGWFLYTPPRDQYGGASVLVPYMVGENNPWAQIQLYFSILSHFPELSQLPGKMHVFNSTKKEGIATEVKNHLIRYGMQVADVGNIDTVYPKTTVEYVSDTESEKVIAMLEKKFGFEFMPVMPSDTRKPGEFYFILGSDYSKTMLLWNPEKKTQEEPLHTSIIEETPNTKIPTYSFEPEETEIATPKTTPVASIFPSSVSATTISSSEGDR